MSAATSLMKPFRVRRAASGAVILLTLLLAGTVLQAQPPGTIDLARHSVVQIPAGYTSANMAIHGVTLGMPWGDARNTLDRSNVPYVFSKGTSPVIYIPPQNSTYYLVLNPSSYEVIEMGIIGAGDLPLDNQYLFDGQRWRLTTARTQFFGNEGEYIMNEEGEAYNFPFLGFVLKYLSPGSFRFVMVKPTNKPLTSYGQNLRGAEPSAPQAAPVPPPPAMQPMQDTQLDAWLADFQKAREQFEARRYAAALGSFRRIADQAPDPLLRIRSVYWMGECYYGLKQFRNAKSMFERVLRDTDIAALREPAARMLEQSNRRIR